MPRRILVVTAHLDPTPERLCRALAEPTRGAEKGGTRCAASISRSWNSRCCGPRRSCRGETYTRHFETLPN